MDVFRTSDAHWDLTKSTINQYNQYKPILNQYLTDITIALKN